ncbi:hypothetical protein Mgra_00000934 [Meloidogyne graminicola]|uniref:PLD phosphodiesterase domain-containing protein n=1 Tax=Meloidogyne graminicola TaxID=189291 RepID=A0A8T0A200_9BILA|nr:hypothetical protein Mgra_00000934 [Meloidogyne graminicola]
MLTDDTLIIGTSNWSGDYFEDLGTGIAIILKQIEENGRKPLIFKQIKNLFERDWNNNCLNKKNNNNNNDDICEKEKDPKLLNNLNKTIINLNNNLRE